MATLIKAYTLSECMDAAVAEIKKLEARGMKNLIFCEDRLTMIAERAIVNALGGSFFTSVSLPFMRWSHRLFFAIRMRLFSRCITIGNTDVIICLFCNGRFSHFTFSPFCFLEKSFLFFCLSPSSEDPVSN